MSESSHNTASAAALARLYDLDLAEDPGDLDLYVALAARSGGPVLELASGSGRVAIPLAAAGYDVTAVDLDPAMIARSATALAMAGPEVRARVDLVEADLVGLKLEAGVRFGLAILALNSIMLLPTRDRQGEALATMARHLRPGGIAVVDSWIPRADELSRYDGRIGLEYVRTDPETGLVVTKTTAAQYEPATGQIALTAIYEEGEEGGSTKRWIREDRLLPVNGGDLAALAKAAGLVVEVLAGDYDLAPITPQDERAVLIARKRPRPTARG